VYPYPSCAAFRSTSRLTELITWRQLAGDPRVSGALCPQTSADRARSCTRIQSWAFASAGMSTKPPRMERRTITAQAGRSSLAVGDTEMTDWRIVQPGDGANPTLVVPERTYVLQPGDAHCYDVGMVHSPRRDGLTKLVRIEGVNLDHIKRSSIKGA